MKKVIKALILSAGVFTLSCGSASHKNIPANTQGQPAEGALVLQSEPDKALFHATLSNDGAAVKQAIASGANVNSTNEAGDAALHLAAHADNLVVSKVLIAAGANVNLIGNGGHTPMTAAILSGKTSTLAFLLKSKAKVDLATPDNQLPICIAAGRGYAKAVDLLLKAKGNPNSKCGPFGRTPLMYAALGADVFAANGQHLDVAKRLIRAKANINARDGYRYECDEGLTAYMLAIAHQPEDSDSQSIADYLFSINRNLFDTRYDCGNIPKEMPK